MDNLTTPDVGFGPWGVRKDEATGFFHLTTYGGDDGRTYPMGKTAYRAARKLNELAIAGGWSAEDAPDAEEPQEYLDGVEPHPELFPDAPAPFDPPKPKAKAPGKTRPEVKFKHEAELKLKREEVRPVPNYATRDEWLNAFIAAARPIFKAAGLELPEKVRASIGWMFRSSNTKTLGQCWHEEASTDGTREIWINPTLGGSDSSRIADVLTHELTHTLFGPDEKHGANFKAAVRKLGLEGKATATTAGPEWHAWADSILAELGDIPHAALDPSASGVKKKATYLLKATCAECEFTFRATAKHLNGKHLICPDANCGGSVHVDGAEDLGGGEGDGE